MTLQSSGVISLNDVLVELQRGNPGRGYPISLGDSDVLVLAGKGGPPISLSDLYGKSSYTPMNVVTASNGSSYSSVGGAGTAWAYPSVSVSQGNPGYSYKWTILSSSGTFGSPVLSNDTSAQCSLSHSYNKNSDGSFTANMQCVITDSTGHQVTVQFSSGSDWYSNR